MVFWYLPLFFFYLSLLGFLEELGEDYEGEREEQEQQQPEEAFSPGLQHQWFHFHALLSCRASGCTHRSRGERVAQLYGHGHERTPRGGDNRGP